MNFFEFNKMNDHCTVRIDMGGYDEASMTWKEGVEVWSDGEYVFIPLDLVDYRIFTNGKDMAVATDGRSKYIYIGGDIAKVRIKLFVQAWEFAKQIKSF